MKKLLAIALFAVLAASSTANAWWGWGRGYYGGYYGGYGYGCGGYGCGGCGGCGGWWY